MSLACAHALFQKKAEAVGDRFSLNPLPSNNNLYLNSIWPPHLSGLSLVFFDNMLNVFPTFLLYSPISTLLVAAIQESDYMLHS